MFKYFFSLFLFKLIIIVKNNPLNFFEYSKYGIDYLDSFNLFRTTVIYILGDDDSFLNDLNLSQQCSSQLKNSFFQYYMSMSLNSYPYYHKLFYDSSKYKNDLSTYIDCINNEVETYSGYYDVQNFTYLTVLIDDKKSLYDILTTNTGTLEYLFGLCFIDNCTTNDYQKIIRKSLIYLNITNNINDTIHYVNNDNEDILPKITIYKPNEIERSKGFIKFLQLLPSIIIFLHLILVIFNSIPIYFYKFILYVFYCKHIKSNSTITRTTKLKKNLIEQKGKQNKNSLPHSKDSEKDIEKERSSILSNYNSGKDNIMKSLELLYDIRNNFISLIELKKQNEITNDGGLAYINGIKGIAMIFFLFGSVYSTLYTSLFTDKHEEDLYSHLNNIFFCIFYIGIKYAPKVLLCTSGFSLFYKLLCFLDGKIDIIKELNSQNDDGKEIDDMKNNSISGISNSNSSYHRLSKKEKQIIDYSGLISFNYLFYFIGTQLHKYILYLLFLYFVLFSLDWIVVTFGSSGPMWTYFNQKLIISGTNFKYSLLLLFGYKSYFISGLCPEKENILNYFYLVFQEIIYFIITSIIIFIGYKKNLKIDRFFKIIFVILIFIRLIYYFSKNGLDDKDYFGYHDYGQFYTSTIYNYSFYIIGIHYGMLNYVIQKGYSQKDINKNNKKYLIRTLKILNASKKKNKKYLSIISIICGILFFLNAFIQQIIIYVIKAIKSSNLRQNMELYKKDFISQIIMLIDSDVFVISINALSLCMYLKGDNLINNILCHSIWSIFNRFYFSYILLINPIILFLLYNTEANIIFNISNCFLYSFISGIFACLIIMIIYITFELPFKKAIRFWFKLIENRGFRERLTNVEATFSYQNDNLIDSVTASITEYNEDEEEEDEY